MKKFELVNKVTNKLSVTTGKMGLKIQEKSPEILLIGGIGGVVVSVVLACRATLKSDDVFERHNERMDDVRDKANAVDEDGNKSYDETEVRSMKFEAYRDLTIDCVKLYAPSVGVGVCSISMIVVSNGIMRRRYAAAVAAYTTLATSFDEYRERVRADGGDDLDRKYMYGEYDETEVRTEVDENGKKKKVKETIKKIDGDPSGYARVFDSHNKNWNKNNSFNLMFIKAQEGYANNLLQTRGHVFLNEVYDSLGFEHTEEGALVGWKLGDGYDDYIDFGLYHLEREDVRRFINGDENVVLLDFNVDGPIFNRLPKGRKVS